MSQSDLISPEQRKALRDIKACGIETSTAPDLEHAGFAVLELDPTDADAWGIFPVLSLSITGLVAEYNVRYPYYYPSFAALIVAAAIREMVT